MHAPVVLTNVRPGGVTSATVTAAASLGPVFVTTRVYEKLVPGVALGGPVFVMDRSADGGTTAVVTLALLLVLSPSATVVVTLAVLRIEAAPYAVGTRNVETIVRVCPAGTVPSAHGNAVVQSPVLPTNVRPAGVGSDTVTPGASLGPWLRTRIV